MVFKARLASHNEFQKIPFKSRKAYLKFWYNLLVNLRGPGVFLSFYNKLLTDTVLFRLSAFFQLNVGRLVPFREDVHFIYLVEITGVKVVPNIVF